MAIVPGKIYTQSLGFPFFEGFAEGFQRFNTIVYRTALRNHNQTVFEEMTTWTALTMHLGMNTTF